MLFANAVCETHLKSLELCLDGRLQRFCQQVGAALQICLQPSSATRTRVAMVPPGLALTHCGVYHYASATLVTSSTEVHPCHTASACMCSQCSKFHDVTAFDGTRR